MFWHTWKLIWLKLRNSTWVLIKIIDSISFDVLNVHFALEKLGIFPSY